MSNPFWFEIIKQWKEKGMGEYGVTFPFLTGALARQTGTQINRKFGKKGTDLFNSGKKAEKETKKGTNKKGDRFIFPF